MSNERYSLTQEALAETLANIADCTVIDYRNFTSGVILFPATPVITGLAFYLCATEGGTYVRSHDASDLIGISPLASEAHPFPDAIKGASFIKLVTLSGAAATVDVILKD